MAHLGIKKVNEMSATEVSKILNVDVKTVLRWKDKGLPMKAKSKAYRSPRIISFKSLLAFLKSHQSLWDSTKVELYALGLETEWLKEKRKMDYKKKIESGNANKKWSKLEEERLIFLRNKNLSLKEISELMGRSEKALSRKYCKLYKEELRKVKNDAI